MKYICNSLNETNELAKRFADKLQGNEIILLNGDLGAGKTTFTKALASAIGIVDVVTSPTFAFLHEYFGKYKLSHYDMYRVEHEDEIWELGISENLEEEGLCVIEWNKFTNLPQDKPLITIDITRLDEDSDRREFSIEGIEL